MVERLLLTPLAAVLATLGVVVALAGRDAAGLSLLAIALLITGRLVVGLREASAPHTRLGRATALRAVLIVSCGLALADSAPVAPASAVVGGVILIALLLVERLLRPVARYQVPVIAHLPNLTQPTSLPDLGRAVVLASLAATAFGLLVAAANGSPWWWTLAGLAAVIPAGLVVLVGWSKRRQARQLNDELPAAFADFAPEFVVYTSRPDDASYQVAMWLPYLERAGRKFAIVTRNGVPAEALAKLTSVPVIEARTVRTVDSLVVRSLRAAFYVNASSGNGAFVRNTELQHVYLGHGDSDKPPSYNPTHAMYNQIFAAGPAAVARYAAHGVHIVGEKFRIVGRPQVEDVQPAAGPIAGVETPRVLYAPTWRGHVEETMLYSLRSGEAIVAALLKRGATVIFRPHPFSYDYPEDAELVRGIQQRLAEDARATGREHLYGAAAETSRSILDVINASDAMVSDVSSVASDYLFSGKPLAMVAVPDEPERFITEYPIARASYVIRGDLDNLDAALDAMLQTDPKHDQRLDVRAHYLGAFPRAQYAEAFVEAVRDVSATSERETEATTSAEVAEESDGPSLLRRRFRLVRRVARQGGLPAVAALLGLIALAVTLIIGPTLASGLVISVTVIAVGVSTRRVLRLPHRVAGSGIAEAARAVLIVIYVVVAAGTGQPTISIALVATALAATLTIEAGVQSAYTAAHAETRNFGAVDAAGIATPPALLAVGHLLALTLALVAAVFALPSWPLAVLLVAVAVAALVRTPMTPAQIDAAQGRFREALSAYRPEFAVYFASTVGASYQVGMWLPYFERVGRPYVIVTRTVPMMNQIATAAQAAGVRPPIIYRPTLRSVEDVVVPTLRAAFYVNNAARNTHLVERRELTHIWLNHGDSEKPACFNPVHAIYDLIFAAGQAGIDRYARHGVHIPAENFVIVGRPQVEQISVARGPVATLPDKTVLYAPTWQGVYTDSRVYSLPLGEQIVDELLARQCRVVFRAHPFNYRYPQDRARIAAIGLRLEADRVATGRDHLWGPAAEQQMSIEDCFNASDAMISDVSAVVSDYLHSGKPLSIVAVGRRPEQLTVDVPAAQAAYVLHEDLSNLSNVADELLCTDSLADVRAATKVYYLGDFGDHSYADGFLDAARAIIDDAPRPGAFPVGR